MKAKPSTPLLDSVGSRLEQAEKISEFLDWLEYNKYYVAEEGTNLFIPPRTVIAHWLGVDEKALGKEIREWAAYLHEQEEDGESQELEGPFHE